MRDVLIILALTITLSLASALAMAAGLVWSLRRRNRVAPKVRTPAPLIWRCSPVAPARLHRRLRRAVRAADGAATRDRTGALGDLAADLAREAVVLDAELVRVWSLPRAGRRTYLRELASRTGTVESSAVRLSALAPLPLQVRASSHSDLDQLTERIDLLAAARADVEQLDRPGLGAPHTATPAAWSHAVSPQR